MKKPKRPKPRDWHKLAILRSEAKGSNAAIPSKKLYNRKKKYKNR